MKRSIYIYGISCAILMLFGSMLKVQHWPGASVLLCFSVLLFCFLFLPLALFRQYQAKPEHKWLYLVTFLVFFTGMMGTLFKIQHWPGAKLFLLAGIPLPFILFLPVYLYQTRNEKKESNINFLGIMFGLTFLAVFSVLLSLNPAGKVLEKIAINVNNNERSIRFNHRSASIVDKESQALNAYIEQLKTELLNATQQGTEASERSADSIQSHIRNVDNESIPFKVLQEGNKINVLKEKINHYREALLLSGKMNPELANLCRSLLNTDPEGMDNGGEVLSWEAKTFPSYNFIMVMDVLTRIQSNAMLLESELK